MDLALNNLQRLICRKTQTTNKQPTINLCGSFNANVTFVEEERYEVRTISSQSFFRMDTFIESTHMKL